MDKQTISDRVLHYRIWAARKRFPEATREQIASEIDISMWQLRQCYLRLGKNWGNENVGKKLKGTMPCDQFIHGMLARNGGGDFAV